MNIQEIIDNWEQEAAEYKKKKEEPSLNDFGWSLANARWQQLIDCIYDLKKLTYTETKSINEGKMYSAKEVANMMKGAYRAGTKKTEPSIECKHIIEMHGFCSLCGEYVKGKDCPAEK